MKTLDWNGTDLPEELRKLPAGRYVITGVEPFEPLTNEQDEGVRQAMAQARRGELLEHDELMEALKARIDS